MTSLSLKNCHNQTQQRVLYLKGEIRHPEIISCTCINQVEIKFEECCVKLRCLNELIEFILTDYRQAVQDGLCQEVRHALKSRLLESKLLRESLCLRTCKLAEKLANLEHRLWLAKQDVLTASRD